MIWMKKFHLNRPNSYNLVMMKISKSRLNQARELHRRAIVIDTHVDTTQRLTDESWKFTERHDGGHVDIPRMKDGLIDAMFFAVYAAGPVVKGEGIRAARAQIKRIQTMASQYPDDVVVALTAEEVRQAKADGKVAVILAIEGGYLIEDSLDILNEYRAAGAAYMTLTHSFHTTWADSAGVHEDLDPLHNGLTTFGREVVTQMNRIGMMVDISHVSDKTFWDVLDVTTAPPIATHSSCRAISPHRRNLTDEMMKAIAARDGVVQINFAAGFIDPNYPSIDPAMVKAFFQQGCPPNVHFTDYVTPLSILVDHFDHALKLIGADHVGIGTDFDGIPALPDDMHDCSYLPNLTALLLDRGYSEEDLIKVLGQNALRVMDACQAATIIH